MSVLRVRELAIGEGIPKICVPIVEKTKDEIVRAARGLCTVPADLVEWRADWFEHALDIEAVKEVLTELRSVLADMPLLFTFRTKAEGGEQEISFEAYSELLICVSKTGQADMVDVEVYIDDDSTRVEQLIQCLRQAGVKVIGSNHDFKKTPDKEEIIRRLCHMQSIGVDIPKIAVMPQNKKDVLTLLAATEEMVSLHAECPIITMSMSSMGAISRIAGETFGSAVTFATAGKASAPGQMEANALKDILKMMSCSCQE